MSKNIVTFRKAVLTIDGIGNTTEIKKITKVVELPFEPQRDMVIFDGTDYLKIGILEYSIPGNIKTSGIYFSSDSGTIRDGEESEYISKGWSLVR